MFHADILTIFVQQIKPIASVIMLLTAIHNARLHFTYEYDNMIKFRTIILYSRHLPETEASRTHTTCEIARNKIIISVVLTQIIKCTAQVKIRVYI